MKPGVFIEVPPARDGAAEKIAELFMKRVEVSFVRDIAPVLLEEYKYRSLDERICFQAQAEIKKALDIVRHYGCSMKCVPTFRPAIFDGALCVSDMLYKREKPPAVECITIQLEENPHCRECICRSCDLAWTDGCLEGADHCIMKCDRESHTRTCPWHTNEREG